MAEARSFVCRDGGRGLINVIAFAEVEEFLRGAGFTYRETVGSTRAYVRGAEDFLLHEPNAMDGTVSERLVDEACYAAGLEPPDWRTRRFGD